MHGGPRFGMHDGERLVSVLNVAPHRESIVGFHRPFDPTWLPATQAVLAQYVPAFDARFLGMYTDAEGTLKIAKDFKVYFEKRPGSTPENYTIDHTAASFVFDPQGRIRLYVKHDQLATLAQDLPLLLPGK